MSNQLTDGGRNPYFTGPFDDETPEMYSARLSLLAAIDKYREALKECETYFAERADAEYSTESAAPRGNEEMRLLSLLRAVA